MPLELQPEDLNAIDSPGSMDGDLSNERLQLGNSEAFGSLHSQDGTLANSINPEQVVVMHEEAGASAGPSGGAQPE
jgi:hypothetical protein